MRSRLLRAAAAALILGVLPAATLGQGAPVPAPGAPASVPQAQKSEPRPPSVPGAGVPDAIPQKGSTSARVAEERDISVLIVAGQESTLSSQMAGKIRKINVGLGDNVRAGTRLLEFDCAEHFSQLQTAQAEYRGARETHLTKLKLQALGAAGELEVTVAAATADKAKSQVAYRQSQLAYCRVPAPFSGRVAKIRVKTAESVALGQALVDVVNPRSLKAQLYVPAAWVQWLRPGMPFQVKIADDGRIYTARVSKLNSRVEGVSQALELEARFEGKTQWLLPGMVGTAIFPNRPSP
jgi:membrane fusion protein (multidrug efflux system)